MKENQGLEEASKGLDWLVSFIGMCFPCIVIVVKYCPLLSLNVVFSMVCMKMH